MTHPALFDVDTLDATVLAAPKTERTVVQRVVSWITAKATAERDAEIAAFIDERGGQFTDEIEREISRRFGGMAG
jgi:Tfp pilus assembly protein PilZ